MRAHSKLHPKTSSALKFICTSMDNSVAVSMEDKSEEEEAKITLEQVNMKCITTKLRLLYFNFRYNSKLILGQLPSGVAKIYQLFMSSRPAEIG